jgi:hypothetical protein
MVDAFEKQFSPVPRKAARDTVRLFSFRSISALLTHATAEAAHQTRCVAVCL